MNELFRAWPKTPRVENKKESYTEKIDGTNACILIFDSTSLWDIVKDQFDRALCSVKVNENEEFTVFAQSRNRLITPEDDNFGFARWVKEHSEELLQLGEGYHYGEWWGAGIGRRYGMEEKVFSLFNTRRWGPHNPNTPACCRAVPTIHANSLEEARKQLIEGGSLAAPGFMNVEGVIVYEYNTNTYWKSIINK